LCKKFNSSMNDKYKHATRFAPISSKEIALYLYSRYKNKKDTKVTCSALHADIRDLELEEGDMLELFTYYVLEDDVSGVSWNITDPYSECEEICGDDEVPDVEQINKLITDIAGIYPKNIDEATKIEILTRRGYDETMIKAYP